MDYKKNNINKTFFIIISLTLLYSCTNSLKENLVGFIENNCKFENNVGCRLDLNMFIKEKFNRIYIFGETTTNEEISKIIGVKYKGNYISDSKYRIIVLMNNRIVFEEDFEEDLFEFDHSDKKIFHGLIYRAYNTSKFEIVRIENNKGHLFYKLKSRYSKNK